MDLDRSSVVEPSPRFGIGPTIRLLAVFVFVIAARRTRLDGAMACAAHPFGATLHQERLAPVPDDGSGRRVEALSVARRRRDRVCPACQYLWDPVVMKPSRSVGLGDVLRAHGIRGEVRVRLYNPASAMLDAATQITVRGAKGEARPMTIEQARPVPGGVLVKFRGVDDRNQAELLRGAVLEVSREVLPPTEPDEFYACDLVGAQVIGPDGPIGTVREIAGYPTTDALVVALGAGRGTLEIPMLDDFIERVDLEQGVVIVRAAALAFADA